MIQPPAAWRQEGTVAMFGGTTGAPQAIVEPANPELGCLLCAADGESQRVLQTRAPVIAQLSDYCLTELYDRGGDLALQYAQIERAGVAPQIYWRSLFSGDVSGVELIVSLQTNRLESLPESTLSTETIGPLWQWSDERRDWVAAESENFTPELAVPPRAGSLWLARISPLFTYCEMTLAGGATLDFSTTLRGWRVTTHLFRGEHLEKGVIRRARAIALLLPREDDQATAVRRFAEFLASPPPLTT